MDPGVKSILYNVLGGIIVSFLTAIVVTMRYLLRGYQLQRLLGFQFHPQTKIRIAYGQLLLPPVHDASGKIITHPYVKAPRRGGAVPLQGVYSIEHPISECEVRAFTYLAGLFGLQRGVNPMLVSDVDADSILDSTFLSIGGPGSNYKTADILASEANIFIRMAHNSFSLPSGETLPFTCSREADHGFILRIRPPEFTDRSWIVCAGLGEWGSSGSAWFIAHKWQELIKRINPVAYYSVVMHIPDFMAMIRVLPGQDQSARIVALYRNHNGQIKNVIQA